MEREGADIGQEGRKGRSTDTGSEALYESRVLLESGVERFADGEDICVVASWSELTSGIIAAVVRGEA